MDEWRGGPLQPPGHVCVARQLCAVVSSVILLRPQERYALINIFLSFTILRLSSTSVMHDSEVLHVNLEPQDHVCCPLWSAYKCSIPLLKCCPHGSCSSCPSCCRSARFCSWINASASIWASHLAFPHHILAVSLLCVSSSWPWKRLHARLRFCKATIRLSSLSLSIDVAKVPAKVSRKWSFSLANCKDVMDGRLLLRCSTTR